MSRRVANVLITDQKNRIWIWKFIEVAEAVSWNVDLKFMLQLLTIK